MAWDDEIVCRCKRFEVTSKAQRFLTVSDYIIRLCSVLWMGIMSTQKTGCSVH